MSITSIHANYKYKVLQKERWSKALGNLLRRSHVHCVGGIQAVRHWFRQTVRNCMYLKTPTASGSGDSTCPSSIAIAIDYAQIGLSSLTPQ